MTRLPFRVRRYHLGLGTPTPTAWDEADAWMAMRADGVR
jgi:hypothetical protein